MSRSQVRRPTGRVGFGADDADCTILHVDMDAFYASVSLRRPTRRSRPAGESCGGGRRQPQRRAVGDATRRARSACARPCRCPGARRMAPQADRRRADHRAYAQVQRNVMALFGSITRSSSRSRSTRRSSTCPARRAGSAGPSAIGEADPRARVAGRAADHLLGRRRVHQVRRQAGLHPSQARRPPRRPGRPRHRLPAPAARGRAVGSGRRRPRSR